jgi:hypothetical protein
MEFHHNTLNEVSKLLAIMRPLKGRGERVTKVLRSLWALRYILNLLLDTVLSQCIERGEEVPHHYANRMHSLFGYP